MSSAVRTITGCRSPYLTAPLQLAAPFALIGLAGGWMTADFFRAGTFGIDVGFRPLLVVITPTVAASLGLALTGRATEASWGKAAVLLAAVVAALGMFCGSLVGFMLWPPHGLFDGAAYGLLCALAFLPAFSIVLAAARTVGRARSGSLVDASDRRAVWLATATAIVLGELAALPDWPSYGTGFSPSLRVSQALGAAAFTAVVVLLARDVSALVLAHRTLREAAQMRPGVVQAGREAVRHLDVGLGDHQVEQVVPAGVVYRDVDRVLQVVRGDPRAARRVLGWAVVRGTLALFASGAVLAWLRAA